MSRYPHMPTRFPKHMHIIDATKIQAYLTCPRAFFYEYCLGWRPDTPSYHLTFGQAWHTALEYIYNHSADPIDAVPEAFCRFLGIFEGGGLAEVEKSLKGKNRQNAGVALVNYVKTYNSDFYLYDVLATEITDTVEVSDVVEIPGGLFLTVKLDAILQSRETGNLVILEHKTASQKTAFWEKQWETSIQTGAYLHACNVVYPQYPTTCLIDGAFFYTKEVAFHRVPINRPYFSMENWLATVEDVFYRLNMEYNMLEDIDADDRILTCFLQNPKGCSSYTGCVYFDLCSCVANPLSLLRQNNMMPPIGFREEWWNPKGEK